MKKLTFPLEKRLVRGKFRIRIKIAFIAKFKKFLILRIKCPQ